MTIARFAVPLFVTFATPAIAGPFGVDVEGFTPEKYSCSNLSGLFYRCMGVPKPHNDFEAYAVQYHKDAGLCMIKGIGKDVKENGYGGMVREKVEEIYSQVSSKYGKLEKSDFLLPSSIWNEPDEWLMGLVKSERVYAYSGEISPSVDGIATYLVAAGATSSDSGYVIVEFYTENKEKCEVANSKDGASSF